MASYSGAIYSEVRANLSNIRTVFRGNRANIGGVIAVFSTSNITNINCTFEANEASAEGIVLGNSLYQFVSQNNVYER